MQQDNLAIESPSPPPRSAQIPFVDKQFSAQPIRRQLTLSYRLLPLKCRKPAAIAVWQTPENATSQ
jgi:hypothetical protein